MVIKLESNNLVFEFPEVHEDCRFSLDFKRTLRIPDDGKTYPLPPNMGQFPVLHVDDYKERVPSKWNDHQGVFMPLYQSEALWIAFHPHTGKYRTGSYPFAIKIAAGKRCALTGKAWWPKIRRMDGEQDYLVIPGQPWLDGFVVEKGKIKQFVAVPLGMGLTVEAQLDGKEEFGGIQIQVYPMKKEVYEKKFPQRKPDPDSIIRGARGMRSKGIHTMDVDYCCATMDFAPAAFAAPAADMGLGAGGSMKQEVYEDKFDLDDWDMEHTSRVFVHLANSLAWEAITQSKPPYPPQTAKDYARHGMPWYDYYSDDLKALGGGELLKGIKSILQLGFQKGLTGVIPENESVEVPSDKVHVIKGQEGEVRNGTW
jgi:hypothetical protein